MTTITQVSFPYISSVQHAEAMMTYDAHLEINLYFDYNTRTYIRTFFSVLAGVSQQTLIYLLERQVHLLTFSCLKKHSIFSSLYTRLLDTKF